MMLNATNLHKTQSTFSNEDKTQGSIYTSNFHFSKLEFVSLVFHPKKIRNKAYIVVMTFLS